jgi:uncharacterized protein (TIGR02646 family)
MIKLQAIAKPVELTNDVVTQLTNDYKATQNDVWKKAYITKALLKMSFGKCCFCETNVNEQSKYMEVEHFHPKSLYPDEVVLWINLLPICKRCNGKKSNHDTKNQPIVHPVIDNPKEHLKLENYRFYGLTELGKCTKDVIDLNNRQRLVDVRYKIGTKIGEELDKLIDATQDYVKETSIRRRNKIVSTLENLMLEGTKEYPYSATTATAILTNIIYVEIKQSFIDNNLWNDEFENLEQQVSYCAFI